MKADNQRPQWIDLYHSTLLETDYEKLPGRLELIEEAIRTRLQSLSMSPNPEELRAIDDARRNLRIIQTELQAHQASTGSRLAHAHAEIAGKYVVFVDANRRYVEVTDDVCQLLGYSRDELLAMTIDDIAAPELRSNVSETFRQYVAAGGLEGRYCLLNKHGQRVPIHYQSKVYPDGCMVARWEPVIPEPSQSELGEKRAS